MSSKYKGFFESSLKKESQSKERSLSFNETHRLPKDLKSRESIEREFKDYLSTKQAYDEKNFERRYISPPFEVSRVPSPVFGYNERPKDNRRKTNYTKLKRDMLKRPNDYLLFETESAPESSIKPRPSTEAIPDKNVQAREKTKPVIKKSYGLHRTLESIIEEEKSGNNGDKSEVPGLFLPNHPSIKR